MNLKIPPVIVFVFALTMLFGCYYFFPGFSYSIPYQKIFSSAFLAIGLLVGAMGIIAFRSQGTTVDPMNPGKASHLVTKGIYRYTRNPMYLGMSLVLFGGFIRLGNPMGILSVLFFVSYLSRFQIKPEEKALKELFGEDYTAYCRKVNRWI